MPSLANAILSSVGKKIINAVSGLGLCAFIVIHLLGNIALLIGNGQFFNRYCYFLENNLGVFVYLAEAGLALFFLGHMITGTAVWWSKLKARPDDYKKSANAGDPSKKTIFSRTMIYTGAVLFVFLIIHLKTFKFGPGMENGYAVTIGGIQMWDLYRLAVEAFSNIWYVVFYVAAMMLLGFHLSHGFWSAFQSLGANHPRYTPIIYGLGILFAIVMAVGFLAIPIVVYLRGGVA